MAVVLFHLWPGRLSGGYIGVDVFFVISGYLITSHLLREVDRTGRLGLMGFWARRARRLLPAAYLVLAATALGIWIWVPQVLWQQFFKEIAAAAFYVENWSLARDSVDYLAAEGAPSPVQHYWTLSAEEQFYIIWPLLVVAGVLFARVRSRRAQAAGRVDGAASSSRVTARRAIFVLMFALTAASLLCSLVMTRTDPAAAYFITPTRAWEFGAGALLAFVPAMTQQWSQARSALSWCGLAGIVALSFVLTESTPMPGTAAIWVVVATILIIWSGDPGSRWSPVRGLALRPVRYIGDISYAMYLWHWPLLIIAPYALGVESLGFWERTGILVLTVGVAALSKTLVEDPARTTKKWGLQRPGRSLALAAAGAAVLFAASTATWVQVDRVTDSDLVAAAQVRAAPPECFGAASLDPGQRGCPDPALRSSLVPPLSTVAKDYAYYPGCDEKLAKDPLLTGCQLGKPNAGKPHVAIIGDSHARSLAPALELLADKGVLSAELFTFRGCAWTSRTAKIRTSFQVRCNALNRSFEKLVQADPKRFDFVITTSYPALMSGDHDEMVKGLTKAWKPVVAAGVPIVAIRDNPTPHRQTQRLQACMSKVEVSEINSRCGLDRAKVLDSAFDPYAPAVEATPGTKYIDLTQFFCLSDSCPVVIGGVNVYRDDHHVTVTFQKTLAPYLEQALHKTGLLESPH